MNIAETISAHARSRPETPALIEGDRTVDYAELDHRIRQGAARLRAQGIGVGDLVAICLDDTADHVIALLAAARLGAVSVPIDWRAPPAERDGIVRRLGAKLALIEAGVPDVAGVPSQVLDASWLAASRETPGEEFPGDPDAPLMIGLTSGTTGAAKGMLVTHRQMCARALPFDSLVSGQAQRYLSASPLAFSAGRNYCLTHLIKGSTVVFHPSLFTADEYAETINRTRATAGFVVPTVIRQLLGLARGTGPLMPHVEMLMCGGAPLGAEEKRATLERITPNFYEFYGTVATGPISFLQPHEMARHAESAGRPAPLWDLEIVGDRGQALDPGATGRLRVRGPALASGPVGTSAGDDEGFRNGWYYTGDLAALDASGFLHLKGRAGDVILRGGSNVYPDEVEGILTEHENVAEAAVIGRASPQLGEEVVAFVVTRGAIDPDALIAHCRARLTGFKVPREIISVASLPKTSFGKVDRKQLRNRLAP